MELTEHCIYLVFVGFWIGYLVAWLAGRAALRIALYEFKRGLCLGTIQVVPGDEYLDGRKKIVRWYPPSSPCVNREKAYGEYKDVFRLEGDLPK